MNPNIEDYLFDSDRTAGYIKNAVERTNAWIDGFKALLVRYETNAMHWAGLHNLAFSFKLLRRKGVWSKKL